MIKLVAPRVVKQPVRVAMHFPRKSKAEIRQIDDKFIRKRMLRDWPHKPYGHDLLELKCGHVRIRWRSRSGPVTWPPQSCDMCTRRDQEMTVRYIRSDLKKRRRAKRKKIRLVRRTPVLFTKRRKR